MAIPGSDLVCVHFWVGSGREDVVGDAEQLVLSCGLVGLQRALAVELDGIRSDYSPGECGRCGCTFVGPATITPPHQLNIMNQGFHQQISFHPISLNLTCS